jgi:hypothetical protein
MYEFDNNSEFESDYESNDNYDELTDSSNNSTESADESIKESTYTPSKENEIRDRSLSLSGTIIYEFAKIKNKLNSNMSEEVKLILNIIGKKNIKPCLEIENSNGGFGEVYVIYLMIASIHDTMIINADNLLMLTSVKSKNEQLYQAIQQAVNSITETVIESNTHIANIQIIPESETHSFFYHYNDLDRVAIKINRFDK